MRRKAGEPTPVEPKVFQSADEIGRGIEKLERRVNELKSLDIVAAVHENTGAVVTAESNYREAIRDIFGTSSPEFKEHEYLAMWDGPHFTNMDAGAVIRCKERGRTLVTGILEGLIGRLQEKRAELTAGSTSAPSTYFDQLNLHPRILDVTRELFLDGHHWEAVFAGAKALVNFVKERSGSDLDGAPLMRTAFSRHSPLLAFNDLGDQTEQDEQEGMMHLFEGAVLGIRNPGGHSFPEGPEQRAVEYILLLSLLAYRTQESRRTKNR